MPAARSGKPKRNCGKTLPHRIQKTGLPEYAESPHLDETIREVDWRKAVGTKVNPEWENVCNHRGQCRVYSWQEKKTKTSWGGAAMDFEAVAAAAVGNMNNADLNRFLVVCALVSDLYCPGYNAAESLSKNSNLARTAARYKIDVERVAALTRADLSKTANPSGKQRPKAATGTKRS
jgi:hypothetical protein